MKLIYIDESGNTAPLSQSGSKFLVLTACIIDEKDRLAIENDLRKIKNKFHGNSDIEYKSHFIRNANPDIVGRESPLKLYDRNSYNLLESELADFMKKVPVTLISIAVDKAEFWKKYPSQNPYDTAYMFVVERVQKHLEECNSSLGIVIIDPREGVVEKQLIGDNLEKLHHKMRFEKSHIWEQTPNIVERLLYSDSKNTIGIQLADLFCYPVYHVFEYNKQPIEYWRFWDITLPKLRKVGDKVLGYGLKIYPDTTKKDLDFSRSDFDGRDVNIHDQIQYNKSLKESQDSSNIYENYEN